MHNHPEYPNRRSIRLPEYDYSSQGAYFVTLVTLQWQNLFGYIENEEVILSKLGKIVRKEWMRSAQIRKELEIHEDEFVVMPNHIHGIVWIKSEGFVKPEVETRPEFKRKPKSLGTFIAGFKSSVSRIARQELDITNIWQRNYYEHVVRDEADWDRIALYIQDNPRKWEEDRFFNDRA
jgi:REP element-mobilizing transposase RayT